MAVMADAAGVWSFTVLLAASSLALCLIRPRWGVLGFACALAFHWGFSAHHGLLDPRLPSGHVQHLNGGKGTILIEGRLYREPEERGSQ